MATPLNTIKNWFKTNLVPTQDQFWAMFDSFWHKDEDIPITSIQDLENQLDSKADKIELQNHKNDTAAHQQLFDEKLDAAHGQDNVRHITQAERDLWNQSSGASLHLGSFPTENDLETAHPSPLANSRATINPVEGDPYPAYWDDNDSVSSWKYGTAVPVGFTPKTGTNIDFTENAYYNHQNWLTASDGDLNLSLANAKPDTVVKIYCLGYVPGINGEPYIDASGKPKINKLNIYTFVYNGTDIERYVTGALILESPTLSFTPGDGQIAINWPVVLGADNYAIEMDTDSQFGNPSVIYSGPNLTHTESGLSNGTTYHFRAISQGEGKIDSDYSNASQASPSSIPVIAYWDARDNSTITDPASDVTQWSDKWGNGHHLIETTDTPTHDDTEDRIVFTGVTGTSSNILSRRIPALEKQDSEDFTIFIYDMVIPGDAAGGNILNYTNGGAAGDGWKLQLSGNNQNLYFQMNGASGTKFAHWQIVDGFNDVTSRTFAIESKAGVLTIYDQNNNVVGTTGSGAIGAIDYGTTSKFKVGRSDLSGHSQATKVEIGRIKPVDGSLSASERASQLAA